MSVIANSRPAVGRTGPGPSSPAATVPVSFWRLRAIAFCVRTAPALRGGGVYTDDKAPVEWLTDLSILSYAVGHR
jgi:hypothetical protein